MKSVNRVILIPDSFKGTMSSAEICAIMAERIRMHYPKADIRSIPVADGGEGSVDCFLSALGGNKIRTRTKNPLFEDMESFYGLSGDGLTAVVEMAACAGLPLIRDRKDPLGASTFGVGRLILAAAERGVRRIVVALGGSATNDGGCGAAAAVGVRFLDRDGRSFIPAGGTLRDIEHIDLSEKSPLLDGVEIITMCDIDNPMHGPDGAAFVFGPQKGATPEQVRLLDDGLRHLSEVIKRDLGQDLGEQPGTGAAGAMGAGMIAFFGARPVLGIDAVLDTVHFDELVAGADLVLTGEGRIDAQSLHGKVVIGVAHRAKQANVPVVAIVGDIAEGIEAAYDEGVSAIFSINRVAIDRQDAKKRAAGDLGLTVDNLMRFLKRLGY